MTDDLADAVAAATEVAFRFSPTDDPWNDVACAAIAAVRAHYLALGGVTDEQTEIAVDEAIDTGLDSGEWAGIVGAVRDLAARAVGHACAERDARITELERVRRIERDVIEDAADAWRERAEAAEDERDALRATVERVRAEVDRWHESHFILARGIRAALDGEA